eukprot:183791-Karenia_brevis.AAC.1
MKPQYSGRSYMGFHMDFGHRYEGPSQRQIPSMAYWLPWTSTFVDNMAIYLASKCMPLVYAVNP